MNIFKLLLTKIRTKFENQKVKIVATHTWIFTDEYILRFKGRYSLFYTDFKGEYSRRHDSFFHISSKNIEDFDKFKSFSYKMCIDFNKKAEEERKKILHRESVIIKDF